MKEIDAITIGAGGGAYPAAFRLKRSGYSVVMVDDKGVMSGNCLSEGCIPSKAVIETIHNYVKLRRLKDFRLDYSDIVTRKDDVQKLRYGQHQDELKEAGLELIKGHAKLIDENTVEVKTGNGTERYRADHIIIASGSETVIPGIPGSNYALTSREFYSMNPAVRDVPGSIAIIGGGYIGLETGSFLSLMGSRVTVIEMLDSVLNTMDPEIVEKTLPLLPKMDIITGAAVRSINKDGKKITVEYSRNGSKKRIDVDSAMLSIGRRAVLPEGIDDLGIKYDKKGITVNSAMQTSIKHIYATGDVNGVTPLFHAAKRQSIVAANNIMAEDVPTDYFDPLSVPYTVYTIPQIAFAGLTPGMAKKRGINYTEGTFSMSRDSMAQIFSEMQGEITILFDDRLKIIGGYVIGNDAGNLINEIGLAVSKGLSARDFAEMAHQHPMTFEGLNEIARKFY